MSKIVNLHFSGETLFTYEGKKLAEFKKRKKRAFRPSLYLVLPGNPKNSFIFGFTSDELVSGGFNISPIAGRPDWYLIRMDCIFGYDNLKTKDVDVIKKGGGTCKFDDIGYDDNWYAGAVFEGDTAINISLSK
jgi:hypothetical protein